MTKVFSQNDRSNDHTVRKLGILFAIALLVIVPVGVTGNEDLQVMDRTTGTTNNAKLGWNITNVGDLNNDGRDDYAIGAPAMNTVYLFYGPISSGFSISSPNLRITGPTSSNFGWSVAGLGDYDRNGRDDLIIGAPATSKAYVFKGGSSGSITYASANIVLEGVAGDMFGHGVAGIDYGNTTNIYAAVGAPRDEHFLPSAGTNVKTGAVFLFNLTYLNSNGITRVNNTLANLTFQGEQNNGWFGFTVANLGNINGDINGDDLGIGDPYFYTTGNVDNGALHIQYSKNILIEIPVIPSSNMDGFIHGRPNSRFGWFVRGVGDISPSPEEDFIVGAPFENFVGHAHLFFGTTSSIQITLSTTIGPDHEFTGINAGDRFGWYADRTMISGASPITITVGAPGYDNVTGTTMTDSGALFSFWDYGAVVNATNARSKFYGDAAGNNLGYALCEVQYRGSTEDDIRILASSPYHGSGDTGKLEIMRRNRLPMIKQLTFDEPTGNLDTIFRLSINYSDPEGDKPSWVEITVYQYQDGTQPLKTYRLNQSAGTDHTAGVIYAVDTKLPNSILDKTTANKPLYMDARTRAVRGSRDIVRSVGGIITGPVVDGVKPSAPEIVSATGAPGNNLDEGTFKFTFEWPEEDEGFLNTLGKVKKLYIAIREGKGNTITEENWYDMNEEGDEFNLSTGKTVIYRIIQFNDVETPFTRTNDYIIGEINIRTNPNGIVLKKMMNYTIALRAEDEVGNVGPISNVVEVETYWRRPEVPPEMETILYDVVDDDGGTLSVRWDPEASMIHPEDLTEYWIYIDTEPLGNISDFDEEPDHILTRVDDYETFLDRSLDVTFYLDETGNKVDLKDGQDYSAAVLGVNWLHQHGGILQWSPQETVINDNESAIAMIKNVNAENYGDDGHQIRLTWSRTNDQKFVEYQIFGREYSYNKIDDAVKITTITDISTTELIIKDIGGTTISQAFEYSFTVLVKDYNRHIIEDVDPANNTARGVKTIAVREEGDVPPQVRGVSLQDKGNDGGGVLQLSWFQQLQTMETSDGNPVGFWQYNIYFSDEPIVDLAGMEPYSVRRDIRDNNMEISQFEGEPLVDGKYYYAVVTTVDFDLVENRELDKNNVDGDRPINQSDTTPPSYPIQNFGSTEQNLYNFTISWTAITEEQVQDFNYYWLQFTGKRSGKYQIENRFTTSWVIEGLERGSEYWVNISIVDLTGNVGSIHPSIKVNTTGKNKGPVIDQINIDINEENFNLTNGGSKTINEADAYIVFFTGTAHDDWTSFNKLIWKWNISTPGGQYIEKNFRSWDLEITDPGEYRITLTVWDDEGEDSDPWTVTFIVEPEEEQGSILGYILIPVLILVFLVAIVVVIFVLMSGKRSQQKQMLEQYEERRKDIQTMEPIYTNLPTWTCDCGATQVQLSKNAYCNSCYQSHEAVPITGLDDYLKEHDLVLAEMKIDIPPGWQGQDMAIEAAKKDLEERKERALKSLNEEFAIWLKGTEYESEIPEPEEAPAEAPAEEGAPRAPLYHHGAIIPGQVAPGGPLQPAPMTPTPMRPMPMGQQPPMQPKPIQPGMPQPIRPPIPGQPQQRPPNQPQQ
ncbi:MAG: FG-GAP-like repeat-containing protein [Thermoplasmatota archaeon]